MDIVRKAILIPYKKGKILIQDRTGHKSPWGYFGGSIEAGETPIKGLIRETKEELSVDISENDVKELGEYQSSDESRIMYIWLWDINEFDDLKFDLKEGKGMKYVDLEEALLLMIDKMDAKAAKDAFEKIRVDINNLRSLIPEIQSLKDNFEKNLWHEESTLTHTLEVLKELNKFKQSSLIPFDKKKIGRYSNYELFEVAILLHDIAKPETKTLDINQDTLFPQHEKYGAEKAKEILKKIDFNEDEIEYITSVIKHHGEPHKRLSDRENYRDLFHELEKQIPNTFKDTVFLAMIDTMGSKLQKKNPYEYNFRIEKYKEILSLGMV